MKALKNTILFCWGGILLFLFLSYTLMYMITIPVHISDSGLYVVLLMVCGVIFLTCLMAVIWMGMPSVIFAVIGGVMILVIDFLATEIRQIHYGWLILLVATVLAYVFLLLAVISKLVRVLRDDEGPMKVVSSLLLIFLGLVILWAMLNCFEWNVPWIEKFFDWHYYTVQSYLFLLMAIPAAILITKWMGNPGGTFIVIGASMIVVTKIASKCCYWMGVKFPSFLNTPLLIAELGLLLLGVVCKIVQVIRDRE